MFRGDVQTHIASCTFKVTPSRRPLIRDFMNPPRRGAPRSAKALLEASERRSVQVKLQISVESAANDAKTARLRALRLEKEALDAQAAHLQAQTAPPLHAKKRSKNSG